MEEHNTADDQSHYEISLTAPQAFVAFVLLLLSLGAAFAFGLMLGKGQADERLIVQKETPVVTEAGVLKKNSGRIVELGVESDDVQSTDTSASTDTTATATVIEEAASGTTSEEAPAEPTAAQSEPASTTAVAPIETTPVAPVRSAPVSSPAARPPSAATRVLAQLLSTGDQKTAEALAVKLINRGFTTAYVERGATDKGPVYRVRVKFNSETEARAAEPKLREFSRDVWITAG